MPIFEFECQKCNAVVERIVLGQGKPEACKCGGKLRRKEFSLPAPAQFKGTGFYQTDYKAAGHGNKGMDSGRTKRQRGAK